MQHAVIAVAHPQAVGERLKVDVGGVGFDRARDHLVDEANDRRLAGEVLEAFGVLLGRLGIGDDLVEQGVAVALLHRLRVKPIECGFELDRHRDRDRDRPPERRRDGVAGKHVERVDHRQDGALAAFRDRHRVRFAEKFRPQPVDEQRLLGIVSRRDKRRRNKLRQGFGEPALADQPELRQHPVEPAPGLGGDAARALQGALVDGAAVDQDRAEPGQRLGGVLRSRGGSRLEGHDRIILGVRRRRVSPKRQNNRLTCGAGADVRTRLGRPTG